MVNHWTEKNEGRLLLPSGMRNKNLQYSYIDIDLIPKLKQFWQEQFNNQVIDLMEYVDILELIELELDRAGMEL